MEALGAEGFVISQVALNAAAANALSQMGVRFAGGSGPLADLVRRRQDPRQPMACARPGSD